MTEFERLHQWLFPGDPLPPQQNPLELGASSDELIAEVAACTLVDQEWLESYIGLVARGLSGLGCLWYLHGATGTFKGGFGPTPGWFRLGFKEFVRQKMLSDKKERRLGIQEAMVYANPDAWEAGRISILLVYAGDRLCKDVTLRIGKLIREWVKGLDDDTIPGGAKAIIKEFDHRGTDAMWGWRISTHPYDVLTMSFNRAWTSCMRPPGLGNIEGKAPLGPLTDMAAGSAVLFIYASGAQQPCGRVIMRPALDGYGDPMILWPEAVKGAGPIASWMGVNHWAPVLERCLDGMPLKTIGLCRLGEASQALSRNIYDDVDQQYCYQPEKVYDEAYALLGQARWPESKLDVGALSHIARSYVDEFDIETRKAEPWTDIFDDELTYAPASITDAEELLMSLRNNELPDTELWSVLFTRAGFGDDPSTSPMFDDFIALAREHIESQVWDELLLLTATGPRYVLVFGVSPYTSGVDERVRGECAEKLRGDVWEHDADTPFPESFQKYTQFDFAASYDRWGEVETVAVVPEDIYDDLVFLPKFATAVIKMPGYQWDFSDWTIEGLDE